MIVFTHIVYSELFLVFNKSIRVVHQNNIYNYSFYRYNPRSKGKCIKGKMHNEKGRSQIKNYMRHYYG